VSLEDRKALLGHRNDEITTHYSAPEVGHLLECAERVCDHKRHTVLRVLPQGGEGRTARVGTKWAQKPVKSAALY
jgi:hypothetical protein